MSESRMKNSIRNIKYSIISYFVILILQFINRTVFIHLLTDEYLGLNGLFSNILSFLSLAELGIGSAINFALYKPLKTGNSGLVKSIMHLYQRLYRIIGIIVLVVGSMLTPFLPFLISDMPQNMPHIYWYYLLYVLNSGISYFYTYKRSLIVCDQREYISSFISTLAKIILSVLQIVVLAVSRSYMFYLILMVVVTVGENLIISTMADRLYPYLKEEECCPLSEEEETQIKKNVFAMMFHKIGTIVVNSTDNIIISKFTGLVWVGLYSNYTLIINAVNSITSRVFTAMTASVGNLALSDDKGHVEEVFYRILFLNFWVRAVCAVCMIVLLQPFIWIWLGYSYLLPEITLLIIVINFYISGMRSAVLTFRDASGIFWNDRYKPLIESVLNLALSIPLAIRYGISGVLLGTIGSTLAVPFWFEGYVLFKYYFGKGVKEYLMKQLCYAAITLLTGTGCYFLNIMIPNSGIAAFIIRVVLCLITSNGIFILVFRRTKEYQYFFHTIKNIISQYMKSKER